MFTVSGRAAVLIAAAGLLFGSSCGASECAEGGRGVRMTLALAAERLGADLTNQQLVERGECSAVDFDRETIVLCEFETDDARDTYLSSGDSSTSVAKLDWLMTISASEEKTLDEVISELAALDRCV